MGKILKAIAIVVLFVLASSVFAALIFDGADTEKSVGKQYDKLLEDRHWKVRNFERNAEEIEECWFDYLDRPTTANKDALIQRLQFSISYCDEVMTADDNIIAFVTLNKEALATERPDVDWDERITAYEDDKQCFYDAAYAAAELIYTLA